MRVPIGYALLAERLPFDSAQINPRLEACAPALGAKPAPALRYEFERPDLERFACLRLAYQALATGGTAPAVLSAANEVAVSAFVEGRLRFGQIPALIEKVLHGTPVADVTLDGVRAADRAARTRAAELLEEVDALAVISFASVVA